MKTKKSLRVLVLALAVIMVFGIAGTAFAITESHSYNATYGTSQATQRVFSTTGSMYSWSVKDKNTSIKDSTGKTVHHVSVIVKSDSELTVVGQRTIVSSGSQVSLPF